MRQRIGIVDIAAAAIVLVAIFLPARQSKVESAYADYPSGRAEADMVGEIAVAQGQLAADPSDGRAAETLATLLGEGGQHDQALRAAGETAHHGGPETWRALRALSFTHANRVEFQEAHAQAQLALQACEEVGPSCEEHEKIRLRLFIDELEAALQAIKAGIDPRREPDKFRTKMQEIHPTTRFRVGGPR